MSKRPTEEDDEPKKGDKPADRGADSKSVAGDKKAKPEDEPKPPAGKKSEPHNSDDETMEAKHRQVLIRNGKFVPSELRVNRGEVVRFVNKDGRPHSVLFTSTPANRTGATGSMIGQSLIDLTMLGVGGQSVLPPAGGGGSMGGTSAGGGVPRDQVGRPNDAAGGGDITANNEAKVGSRSDLLEEANGRPKVRADGSVEEERPRAVSAMQGIPARGGPCTPVDVTEEQYVALAGGGAQVAPRGTFEKVFDASGDWHFRSENDDGDHEGVIVVE